MLLSDLIKCPKCGATYDEDFEKESIISIGHCSTCDHHSVFDEMTDNEIEEFSIDN